MAGRILWTIRISCAPEQADAFNAWYNEQHVPDFMRAFPACVQASRYASIPGPGQEQEFFTVYEFNDEAAVEAALANPALKTLSSEFSDMWGAYISKPSRVQYREMLRLTR